MNLHDALDFAKTRRFSVLVTIRSNGRPQLSNVGHLVSDDGLIRISIATDRAKYKNLMRDPWAALHVTRDDYYAYAIIEADVELSPLPRPRMTRQSKSSSRSIERSWANTRIGASFVARW